MKSFGHVRPLRDKQGEIIGSKSSPVRVRTREPLPGNYLRDKGKRLIYTAHRDDILGVRPERTTRELFIKAIDLYALLVRRQANNAQLEKARARKAKRQQARESRRVARQHKRLFDGDAMDAGIPDPCPKCGSRSTDCDC